MQFLDLLKRTMHKNKVRKYILYICENKKKDILKSPVGLP